MSRSLTLIFDHFGLSGPLLAYERLRLNVQDYEMFDRLAAEAVQLPQGVHWYGDEGLTHEQDDPYGKRLTYVAAHTLERRLAALSMQGWDAAVYAFVKTLSPDTKIVLWWD